MDKITLEEIRDFVIVLLAILAFVVLLGNVIRTVREWRKPGMDTNEWRRGVDIKLEKDNARIKTLEDGNKAICKALMAILSHEINGESKGELQKAYSDLNDYLINR